MVDDDPVSFPDNGSDERAPALSAMFPETAIERASTLCYALSNPIRMKILLLLASRTYCVHSIRDLFAISDSRLSYHLKILRDCGLIEGSRDGKCINYATTPQGMEICRMFGSFRW
ncbi:MAG: metalloregulator ArsR/SmtB family transcription factor [Methanomicrobiaceae archaeon]|nr:metalloregulator ArsR/SmtB family transcription factor [Methanomicrobiaceae archaeon]